MNLETCDLWDIWSDRFLEGFQIFGNFLDFWKIFWCLDTPRTCDIWDTDYNSDNWEPEFMTIFVIWQIIVTLDSIRNSCDVFLPISSSLFALPSFYEYFPSASCTSLCTIGPLAQNGFGTPCTEDTSTRSITVGHPRAGLKITLVLCSTHDVVHDQCIYFDMF